MYVECRILPFNIEENVNVTKFTVFFLALSHVILLVTELGKFEKQ